MQKAAEEWSRKRDSGSKLSETLLPHRKRSIFNIPTSYSSAPPHWEVFSNFSPSGTAPQRVSPVKKRKQTGWFFFLNPNSKNNFSFSRQSWYINPWCLFLEETKLAFKWRQFPWLLQSGNRGTIDLSNFLSTTLFTFQACWKTQSVNRAPPIPPHQRHLLTFIAAYEPDRLEMSHLHVAFALGTCFSDLH